jgi:hypothetical protein
MSRERIGFRENLQDILEFSGGRRMLTIAEVKAYTGLTDYRTIKRRFPFKDNYISAPTLALHLSGGATNE